MTSPASTPLAGPHISTTVKWYDPAKGYGFLIPDDGSADIHCRISTLSAVGLGTLLSGARVVCETVETQRGREVSRILNIDFSAAAPAAASSTRASGNGRPANERGMVSAGADGTVREVRAFVKWFDTVKGYGFLQPDDMSADLFCHVSALQGSGQDTLPEGAAVTCMVVRGDRGPQVSRILSVEPPVAVSGAADRNGSFAAREPVPQTDGLGATDMEVSGTVKFFDPVKGFGFVVPDEDGPEVFVHASVLFRSGMTDLEPGQRVLVFAESVPRGLQATGIEPL